MQRDVPHEGSDGHLKALRLWAAQDTVRPNGQRISVTSHRLDIRFDGVDHIPEGFRFRGAIGVDTFQPRRERMKAVAVGFHDECDAQVQRWSTTGTEETIQHRQSAARQDAGRAGILGIRPEARQQSSLLSRAGHVRSRSRGAVMQ